MVGEFLVRFFSDQAAGRATQDVTEQIDYELRSLLDTGAIAFPSAFTFVARAFTSVDGIAKSLRPDIELRHVASSRNLRFHGRFFFAYLQEDAEYVSVWDDDMVVFDECVPSYDRARASR